MTINENTGLTSGNAAKSTAHIKICIIHPESRLCTGRLRSIDEIGTWLQFVPEVRHAVMWRICPTATIANVAEDAPRVNKRSGGRAAHQADQARCRAWQNPFQLHLGKKTRPAGSICRRDPQPKNQSAGSSNPVENTHHPPFRVYGAAPRRDPVQRKAIHKNRLPNLHGTSTALQVAETARRAVNVGFYHIHAA
jgi:predicted Fe-S protein YdhL (DUF1289 family)